jgi:PAS domain S-box-containing protein
MRRGLKTEGISVSNFDTAPLSTAKMAKRVHLATEMQQSMVTIDELRQKELPFVTADQEGMIEDINTLFQSVYGWSLEDLKGKSLSMILPDSYKDAHHLGFSRFQIIGESQILNHPLELMTICKDARQINSEHFIVAERQGDTWRFAATLRPLE